MSAASSWEISIKFGIGKLPLPEIPEKYIPSRMRTLSIKALDVKHRHTFLVSQLPQHHRDPFDRILITSAIAENMYLMSADEKIRLYDVDLIWGLD